MGLEIHKQFFANREDVLRDIQSTGFWPTTFVSSPSPELPVHWHDLEVHTYVMEGETYIVDGETGEHRGVEAGDKLVISPGTLHAEGEVKERVVYILALPEASNLEPLFAMKTPDERE